MAMNFCGLNPGDMLTSSRTGCTHESLPTDCQATALADGVKGEFSCKTFQAALFPLAESQPEIKRLRSAHESGARQLFGAAS